MAGPEERDARVTTPETDKVDCDEGKTDVVVPEIAGSDSARDKALTALTETDPAGTGDLERVAGKIQTKIEPVPMPMRV